MNQSKRQEAKTVTFKVTALAQEGSVNEESHVCDFRLNLPQDDSFTEEQLYLLISEQLELTLNSVGSVNRFEMEGVAPFIP